MANTIIERPAGGSRKDAAGPHRQRAWTVEAESEYDAEQRLANGTDWGYGETIYRGRAWQDHQGNTDYGVICLDLTTRVLAPAPRNGTGLYDVTATYGYPSVIYRRRPTGLYQLTWWMEPNLETGPTELDRYGYAVANKAGELYEPASTKYRCGVTLVLQWLEDFTTPAAATTKYIPYISNINSVSFWTFPPESLLCQSVIPEESHIPGTSGWTYDRYRMTARFVYKAPYRTIGGDWHRGWRDTRIHRGMCCMVLATLIDPTAPAGEYWQMPLRDATGQPYSRPMLLTETARVSRKVPITQPDGTVVDRICYEDAIINEPNQYVWHEFEIQDPIDFNEILKRLNPQGGGHG